MKNSKITKLENKLKEYISMNIVTPYLQIMAEFLNYWKISDYMRRTNHSEVIEMLYLKQSKPLNLTQIAIKCYINDKTLYEYRKNYMKSFEFILKQHNILL